MTPARRLPTLATIAVAFLVGGCIGFTGDPTAPPATVPAPSPTRTLPDFASFTPFPVATATPEPCPAATDGWDATLNLPTATGIVSIPLEEGVTVPLPSESIAPLDPADVAIEGTVLGGTEIRADLVLGSLDNDPSITITALTARFVPLDASPAAPVVVALDGQSIVLTLSDNGAIGRLMLQIDWTSRCGAGSGGGATALTVEPSSVAVGCPTNTDDIDMTFQDFASWRITIGGISEPLDIYGWSTRWILGNGVTDYGTLFPNWERNVVISVAPEGLVPVREKIDELHLVSVRASIYRRADVDTYFETDEFPDPVTVVRRNVNPNGNVNIPAPLEPGNYVFDIDATWLTSCFELNTTRTVSVKVS